MSSVLVWNLGGGSSYAFHSRKKPQSWKGFPDVFLLPALLLCYFQTNGSSISKWKDQCEEYIDWWGYFKSYLIRVALVRDYQKLSVARSLKSAKEVLSFFPNKLLCFYLGTKGPLETLCNQPFIFPVFHTGDDEQAIGTLLEKHLFELSHIYVVVHWKKWNGYIICACL